MAKQKQEAESFKEFLREYEAAQSLEEERPINTSKFTLMQQLKRFNNFSHSASECEMMNKELHSL